MPRNHQQIPREERVGDLLAAATELFLAKGYDATTMADISAAAGVARANLYWYFTSKDAVFAAVMDRMLKREIRILGDELAGADAMTRLLRGLSDMRRYRPLHQSMHDRLTHSDDVRAAHDTFLAWIASTVDEVVEERGTTVDSVMMRDLTVAVFEGANVPNQHNRPAHELLRFLMEALLKPEAGDREHA